MTSRFKKGQKFKHQGGVIYEIEKVTDCSVTARTANPKSDGYKTIVISPYAELETVK